MDCNSYSYAPSMLDAPAGILASYKNDDMEIELEQIGPREFSVWAYSYDGSLDVSEVFFSWKPAEKLYRFILDSYTDTPPGRELDRYISTLPNRYGAA